ncbi:MAG: RHS repeat protein, partial [Acidobacteria bacterium]|nr:RHS repeat protein [Acidobacteriota bacterium]
MICSSLNRLFRTSPPRPLAGHPTGRSHISAGLISGGQVNGTQVYPTIKDTNGNYFSKDANGNPVDTLGRTALVSTVNGNTTTYDIPNSQGGTSRFTATTSTISVNTNFGQTGVTECSTNCTITVITRLDLPVTGMSYIFDYDSGTTPGNFGLLKTVTLPTGGTVNYTHTTFADAYGSKNRWVYTRTSGGGQWTYAPQVITTCAQGGVNCQQKVTVTKPSSDQCVHTFTMNNGAWNSQTGYYNGAVAPANLVMTLTTDYDYSNNCLPNGCTGARYITTTRNTTVIPGTTTLTRKTEYSYDSPTYANVAEVRDWNYYTGAAPSTPDFKTNITYVTAAAYTGIGIINRPLTVTKRTGSGTWISQTKYTYDTGSISTSGATNIVHHDDTTFGSSNAVRGNPTKMDALLASGASCPSSTCLETVLSYDITGQLVTGQDVAGNATTYSYTDSFFTDSGANPPQAYTPTQATNAYRTKVTRPLGLITTYGYYFGSGNGALVTGPNGNTQYAHYIDSLDRVTQRVDELGNATNFLYTGGTQVESILSFNGGASAVDALVTLDGLGRVSTAQTRQSPGSSNFDTVSGSYDTSGRLARISMPCVATAGQACPSTPATTFQYDGVNRRSSVTDGGGGTLSYVYSSNDIKRTAGPAPTTSSQLEYDGLGRLTSACELTATLPGNGNCTQTIPQTGYWTQYGYTMGTNSQTVSVTQNVQSSPVLNRTYTYDPLGRLTSELNPESGLTQYFYDTAPSSPGVACSGTSGGDLIKRYDANGNTTCYTYDPLHRVTSTTYSGPNAANHNKYFVYDAASYNGTS